MGNSDGQNDQRNRRSILSTWTKSWWPYICFHRWNINVKINVQVWNKREKEREKHKYYSKVLFSFTSLSSFGSLSLCLYISFYLLSIFLIPSLTWLSFVSCLISLPAKYKFIAQRTLSMTMISPRKESIPLFILYRKVLWRIQVWILDIIQMVPVGSGI